MFEVTEVSIAELRKALESGQTTAVELVKAYLARIDAYNGPETQTKLNAVVVRNPDALAEAEASDARRARGEPLGPLDGIPYTAKDSYLVKGLTAAAGSPAFKDLIAQYDAFAVERLRTAGAICLGKPTCRQWLMAACSEVTTGALKVRITPIILPHRSPPVLLMVPVRVQRRVSPHLAWLKKPGRAAEALLLIMVCALIRRHAA